MPLLGRVPGRGQRFGLYANLLRNREQIGLVRLEECDQCRKQYRVVRPAPKFICPNSGQVEEPLRPPLVAKRCRKSGKGNDQRIAVWRLRVHRLDTAASG